MAERRTPRRSSTTATRARKRAKSRSDADATNVAEDVPPGGSDSKRRSERASEERIVELETQLATATAMLDALLSMHEQTEPSFPPGLPVQSDGRSIGRTRSVLERGVDSVELEIALRRRTRALIESERQLEFKNTELERLNEMKVEFISIATHELRTPLTSIVGYLDLLEEGRFGDMPEDMERPMVSLRRNAHRLKRLVDEMLDVSRIDSGRVTLFRSLCDLREIVRQVVADLQSQAATKRQELDVTLGEPPEIFVDVDKMRQIATKVIANAIRHAPEGGVIHVMLDTAPPERFAGTWARLRVRATGISIPTDMRSLIFEPFASPHKAKHHTSAGPDAAGLGLYIARGLIDLHGGLISVDSIEGEYTEFTVLLPRSEPTETD